MKSFASMLVNVALVVASFSTTAHAASITLKDGSVVEGEILGSIVLSDGSFGFAIINGKDILRIDETGVQLKSDAVVINGGLALDNDPQVFARTKTVDLIRTVLPLVAKKEAVKEVERQALFDAATKGHADGPGGSRVYFFKRVAVTAGTYPLSGELRSEKGNYTILPALRVSTSEKRLSVRVDSVIPFKQKPK